MTTGPGTGAYWAEGVLYWANALFILLESLIYRNKFIFSFGQGRIQFNLFPTPSNFSRVPTHALWQAFLKSLALKLAAAGLLIMVVWADSNHSNMEGSL